MKRVDLYNLFELGIITKNRAFKLFKKHTNYLGEFVSVFPESYKNGDSFCCDGKYYRVIDGEICHTGWLVDIELF